jgi:activating signal cointegrator 1
VASRKKEKGLIVGAVGKPGEGSLDGAQALPEIIRCLPCSQPVATLIMRGIKCIDTRPFQTDYRGPVAILATQKQFRLRDYSRRFIDQIREDGLFADHLQGKLLYGVILGTVDLVNIYPAEDERHWTQDLKQDDREQIYGDFSPGRFGWHFANVQTFANPIPFKGQQGFFELRSALLRQEEVPA